MGRAVVDTRGRIRPPDVGAMEGTQVGAGCELQRFGTARAPPPAQGQWRLVAAGGGRGSGGGPAGWVGARAGGSRTSAAQPRPDRRPPGSLGQGPREQRATCGRVSPWKTRAGAQRRS